MSRGIFVIKRTFLIKVVSLSLMVCGFLNCTPSKESAPSTPNSPAPATENNSDKDQKHPDQFDVTERSFEDAVRSKGVSVKIIDLEFMDKLNHDTRSLPMYLQHGKLLHGDSFVRSESYCSFAIGKGYTDNYSYYPVDAESMKQVGLFGAHVLRFSMGKLFAAECTTSADRDLTLSDFIEIVGNLLSIKSNSKTSPTSEGSRSSEQKKIEIMLGQDGSPQIGIQFATGSRKIIAVTFSISGNQLVGNMENNVFPSYIAIIDRESNTYYAPTYKKDKSHIPKILPRLSDPGRPDPRGESSRKPYVA